MIVIIILLTIIAINNFIEIYVKIDNQRKFYYEKYHNKEEDINFSNPDIDRDFWFGKR